MADPLHVHFEDLETGQVLQLGATAVDEAAIDLFVAHFAPGWDAECERMAAQIEALGWERFTYRPA